MPRMLMFPFLYLVHRSTYSSTQVSRSLNPNCKFHCRPCQGRLWAGPISWYCEACLLRATRRSDKHLAILIENERDGHTDSWRARNARHKKHLYML
ncbi:hypothetical protein F5Y07DRAFT_134557 [Xylaria sp. FL0933]|nr:hypothetical protein F5Y07DRAFT_134557 [Xylaria sp. FL0933]